MLAPDPTVLGTYPQYKIQAVECLPGSPDALLGTDDENLGGYIREHRAVLRGLTGGTGSPDGCGEGAAPVRHPRRPTRGRRVVNS